MYADAPRGLLRYFDELKNPRVERTELHRLDDIIALAILATIAGADRWTDVAQFGREKYDWLKTILHLPHGTPSQTPAEVPAISTRISASSCCVLRRTRNYTRATPGREFQ